MQAFKHVIEIRELTEQIDQQFPIFQSNAKGKVAWHTHSPIIVPCEKQISGQIEGLFSEPIVMHGKERRTFPAGMQFLHEWLLPVRSDVPVSSSLSECQTA